MQAHLYHFTFKTLLGAWHFPWHSSETTHNYHLHWLDRTALWLPDPLIRTCSHKIIIPYLLSHQLHERSHARHGNHIGNGPNAGASRGMGQGVADCPKMFVAQNVEFLDGIRRGRELIGRNPKGLAAQVLPEFVSIAQVMPVMADTGGSGQCSAVTIG